MTTAPDVTVARWRGRGVRLEVATLAWNVVGVVVLAVAAAGSRSTALIAFGADSLIEIGASTVVLWDLAATNRERRRPALRLLAVAFGLLAAYLAGQSAAVLATGHRASSGALGIGWTAATVVVMVVLAVGKRRAGAVTGNPVMTAEAGVTVVDAAVALVVLLGIALDVAVGWWWADPAAALLIAAYAAREARAHWRHAREA